jgi:hypothetical protein
MVLTSDFEPVCVALLQQVPLPILEFVVDQLLSHETRLLTFQPHHSNAILATYSSFLVFILSEWPEILQTLSLVGISSI